MNILVAEDHPLVLLGIQAIIREILPGSEVHRADSFPKALKLLDKHTFNLVIMDIHMPGGDSVTMVESIRLKQPGVPILVNSSYDEQLYALPFLKAGANGFISKTAADDDFKAAVESVINGKIYASPEVLQSAFKQLFQTTSQTDHAASRLSDKELEVAKLLAKGFKTKDISEMLFLSPSSISNYKAKIFEKLGVTNVIELTICLRLNDPSAEK